MYEKTEMIETNCGKLDTFLCYPKLENNLPIIIFYMDAPAIREELREMSRRIASNGYNVLLPNLFYRDGTEGKYPFNQNTYKKDKTELKKMISTMNKTTNKMIIEDTKFLLEYIDNNFKNTNNVGILGYCMSGRFVISCGGTYPKKIKAIASFYGVDICTDKPDSAHIFGRDIDAELYLAFAEKDAWVNEKQLDQIKNIFKATSKKCTIEIYPATDHGFAFPERNTYNKDAAERHWIKMMQLFNRNLKD